MKKTFVALACAVAFNAANAGSVGGPTDPLPPIIGVPPVVVADCLPGYHHPTVRGTILTSQCVADGPHVMFLITAIVDPVDFHTVKVYAINTQHFSTYDKCQAAIERFDTQIQGSPLGNSGYCVAE